MATDSEATTEIQIINIADLRNSAVGQQFPACCEALMLELDKIFQIKAEMTEWLFISEVATLVSILVSGPPGIGSKVGKPEYGQIGAISDAIEGAVLTKDAPGWVEFVEGVNKIARATAASEIQWHFSPAKESPRGVPTCCQKGIMKRFWLAISRALMS